MPHIILECSDNIVEEIDLAVVGSDIHGIFIKLSDTFKLGTLRTRVVRGDYHIADGNNNNSFVHANIELIAGRPLELKKALIDEVIIYLNGYFSETLAKQNCVVSVELREIDPELFKYAKVPA